ncbi:MAG: MBL fold metallo-hydrolase [Asgard group archaeon]|nr:MBL fold metallo-hydrolase [Asgard group archaeon]
MEITKIGSRGTVFTFDDLSTESYNCPTNVYVINGEKHIFICDTFLGPNSMKGVNDYIKKYYKDKTLIIFNSHYDYDHHWGNCAFKAEKIIAHKLCKARIKQEGKEDLENYKDYIRGNVVITLPDTVFEDGIDFPDEEVRFFHSPGHTEDSSSCIDMKDKILFAADNIEDPIPYIRSNLDGIRLYTDTLKKYLEMDWSILIPGHGSITNKTLLLQNLTYLESFPNLTESVNVEKYGNYYYRVHLQNLSTFANILQDERNIGEALKYYQKIITLGEKYKLLKKETIDKIKQKILDLKIK